MIIKQVHVDLWQKILQPITVVQHEAEGRRLAITLTGGGLPVNLTGCDVVFYAQKPDENILFNNCVIVDEAAGQVEYTITEQTVVLAGTLKCWIVVIKDGKTIRSQEFHITVQESPDFTGAVESTSEFTDLEVALATIAGFDARLTAAEGDIDGLDTRLTAAEGDIDDIEASLGNINKLLWSGSWSSGDITVPGASNYTTFIIRLTDSSMFATYAAASPTVNVIRGIGSLYWHTTHGHGITMITASYVNETWTAIAFKKMFHTPSSSHDAGTDETIKSIYGVI